MADLAESYKALLDAAEKDAHEGHAFGCGLGDPVDHGELEWHPRERWREFCDCKVRPRLLDIYAKRKIVAMYEDAKATQRPDRQSRIWDLEVVSRSAKLVTLGQVIEILAAAHFDRRRAAADELTRLGQELNLPEGPCKGEQRR